MNRWSTRSVLGVFVLFTFLSGVAAGADPLVESGAQDWLRRVVPSDLAPPANSIPQIAIIEQGFDESHPEMSGGWVSYRRLGAPPRDLAGAIDFLDGVEHGTAVASVIGAPRNGIGMEGVLPGASVWVYRATLCRDVAAAMRTAARDGAKVINASFGFMGPGTCRELTDAVSYAYGFGALIVASAGNNRPNQRWHQPAEDYHVLTVGALTAFDQPASFSDQTNYLDVMAPGEGVLTACPTVIDLTCFGSADGYSRVSGTSFSSPITAAVAAWVWAARPKMSAGQVADVIRFSARDLGRPGWDRAYGYGAVDLRAALVAPTPQDDPLEPNEDIKWIDGRGGFDPDPPLLRGRRRDGLAGSLDLLKDPFDMYRVKIPLGASVRITVRPGSIAADLYVWNSWSRTANSLAGLIAASTRRGLATESLIIGNPVSRRPVFVEVRSRRGGALAGRYQLGVRRVR